VTRCPTNGWHVKSSENFTGGMDESSVITKHEMGFAFGGTVDQLTGWTSCGWYNEFM